MESFWVSCASLGTLLSEVDYQRVQVMSWYVYILKCSDNTYYTGVTKDLKRRVEEHNGDDKKAAKYTKSRRPVRLFWSEPHESRSSACQREAAIKRMKRIEKLELASGV